MTDQSMAISADPVFVADPEILAGQSLRHMKEIDQAIHDQLRQDIRIIDLAIDECDD